jgi:hypothetical protein
LGRADSDIGIAESDNPAALSNALFPSNQQLTFAMLGSLLAFVPCAVVSIGVPGGAMAKEKVRERVAGTPSAEYFKVRGEAGWKLVAVEWERETDAPPPPEEEVPYGMRVGSDCAHLEYNAAEMAVMTLIMELIIQEHTFSRMAEELNHAGFRRRTGELWSPISVFNLLPRIIEIGPRMFSTAEWAERRHRIYALMGKRQEL